MSLTDSNPKKPSRRLTFDEAVEIWILIWQGHFKNRIAARFDVNVWRIYDIKNGKLHPGSQKVAEKKWEAMKGSQDVA